jgi:hypothetical protein
MVFILQVCDFKVGMKSLLRLLTMCQARCHRSQTPVQMINLKLNILHLKQIFMTVQQTFLIYFFRFANRQDF